MPRRIYNGCCELVQATPRECGSNLLQWWNDLSIWWTNLNASVELWVGTVINNVVVLVPELASTHRPMAGKSLDEPQYLVDKSKQ